jgi:3-hydroxyisobutyrate dehydrogenase-like beta-hydroxyacid dehydrogenase/putative methionine-R-sulfoxide reductase with GAF domain
VVVWNRTPERATALRQDGAEVAASPAAAVAQVDVVITMVADPAALAAVSTGPEGFASATRSGQTVIEMSTVGPAALDDLRRALPEGVALVDAPVLGSIEAAASGTLAIFVGGAAGDVDRVRPLLAELGTPIHVGGSGAGAAAKLVANSTLVGATAVLGEAVALGDALGLQRETAFEVLKHTPLAAQADRRRDAVSKGSYPPRFALSLARKDADLITAAGADAGLALPVAAAVRLWLKAAEAAGAGASDYTAVLDTIVNDNARGAAAPARDVVAAVEAVASSRKPREAVAFELAQLIRTHGDYRWVGLYDVGERDVVIIAWSGAGPPAHPRFPRERGLTARAIERARTVVVDDVAADGDYLEAFGDTRSEAIVPVIFRGSVVGTIDVESNEPAAFTNVDAAFLERVRDAALPLWQKGTGR